MIQAWGRGDSKWPADPPRGASKGNGTVAYFQRRRQTLNPGLEEWPPQRALNDDGPNPMSSSVGSVGHRLYPGPEADTLSRRSWLEEGERGTGGKGVSGRADGARGGQGKVKTSARDYFTHSSLHGLKYIAEKGRHPVERLFWALAFLGGLGLSGFFIAATWQRWNESPVLVSLDTLAAVLQEIPFPAVTVCNINKMKKSMVMKITQSSHVDLTTPSPLLISSFMGLGSNLSEIAREHGDLPTGPITGDEMKDFMTKLLKVTPSCGDILRLCRFGGKTMDCATIFNEVITDDGMCCAFNTLPAHVLNRQRNAEGVCFSDEQGAENEVMNVWTPERGYPHEKKPNSDENERNEIPRRGSTPGISGGLTILLDAQVDDYYLPRSPSVGFKVLIHSPSEVPAVRELGMSVSLGSETLVAVRPVVVRSTPGIQALPSNRRRCFLQWERRLAYFRLYSLSACRTECLANFTLKACSCKEYFMPANIGGLLGLCLGFSFLSAVEIVYFATLRMGLLGKKAT
ncbi:pickpocket protein 28-like [Hetaerina americana]|uniref:pickpocket protein 28-like n=1 Tax=Hetaerina americana TaxID=62018 RepID=UPI003A7F530F